MARQSPGRSPAAVIPYKPHQALLFGICLVPLRGCVGGILRAGGLSRVPGFDLGADPVRFVLDTLGKTGPQPAAAHACWSRRCGS